MNFLFKSQKVFHLNNKKIFFYNVRFKCQKNFTYKRYFVLKKKESDYNNGFQKQINNFF